MAIDIIARGMASQADSKAVTAYQYAVEAGYTGTEEEFAQDIGNSATNATNAHNSAVEARGYAEQAEEAISIIPITYSEIVSLRIGNQLVAGATYRITDYVTKINGTYDLSPFTGMTAYLPVAKSAEHPFDLVVKALTTYEIDAHARAVLHDGDTYFEYNKLEAWDILYTLDNDTQKYMWADEENGKGVIYYMKDEFNNSAGYDFKNIQAVAFAIQRKEGEKPQRLTSALDYDEAHNVNRFGSLYGVFQALLTYMQSGGYDSPWGFYDFVVGSNIVGVIQFPEINDTFLQTFNADLYYTFDYYEAGNDIHYDASLNTSTGYINTFNNTIMPTVDALYQQLAPNMSPMGLSFSIFENNDLSTDFWLCSGNYIGEFSYLNIFGHACYENKLSDGCYSNIMSNKCYANTFGFACQKNILIQSSMNIFQNGLLNNVLSNSDYNNLGDYCESNCLIYNSNIAFGNNSNGNDLYENSYNISFGDNCFSNKIETGCHNIIFGGFCDNNTLRERCNCCEFGIGCSGNILGSYCTNNVFVNTNQSNRLSSYCDNNTFYPSCSRNVLNERCCDNVFGTNCSENELRSNCSYNSFNGNNLSNLLVENSWYNTLGKRVSFVKITRDSEGSSDFSSFYCLFLHVCDSVKGTSVSNRIVLKAEEDSVTDDIKPEKYVGYNQSGRLVYWYPSDYGVPLP